MLHKTYKTAIYWFTPVSAITFVLKLALLVPVKLIFIHGECEAIDQLSNIVLDLLGSLLADNTAGSLIKSWLINGEELVPCIDIAEAEKVAIYQL